MSDPVEYPLSPALTQRVLDLTKVEISGALGAAAAERLSLEVSERILLSDVKSLVGRLSTYVHTEHLISTDVPVHQTKTVTCHEYVTWWDHLKDDLLRKPVMAHPDHARRNRVRRALLRWSRVNLVQRTHTVTFDTTVTFTRDAIFPDADLIAPMQADGLGAPVIHERWTRRP